MSGGPATNGTGGNGGYLSSDANVYTYDLDFRGGNASSGSGGNGGGVNVDGTLYVSYVDGSGGYCNSDNESHTGGNAGSLSVNSLSGDSSDIYLRGGNREGDTSVANPVVVSNNGGNLSVEGDATFDDAYLEGGDVSTAYSNAAGGAGGNLNVFGSLRCNIIRCDGGESSGFNGGAGGEVTVGGHAVVSSYLSAKGGDSNSSTDAPSGGVRGPGPLSVSFTGGCRVRLVDMTDGSGVGSDPSAETNLYLAGSCHFGTLNVSDRPECFIRPMVTDEPVIFQTSIMAYKDTLNTYDGGASTVSLTADLATSIFTTSNGDGNWYKITGVSAM